MVREINNKILEIRTYIYTITNVEEEVVVVRSNTIENSCKQAVTNKVPLTIFFRPSSFSSFLLLLLLILILSLLPFPSPPLRVPFAFPSSVGSIVLRLSSLPLYSGRLPYFRESLDCED